MAESVVGIDIGSTSLRAVEVGGQRKPKPTLLRYCEVPLSVGAVISGEVVEPNTVAAALKHLWSVGGFKSRNVVLGMGNQRVLARDLIVPRMSLARIRESLPFEVQEMLPVPVAEAVLDFYPIAETAGDNGPMVRGLLIAAVKQAVLSNVNATQMAGLTTVDVDLIPFALSRVLLTRPKVPGTVALVDIGGSTTSVVIATDGVPQFVRIIATGGDDISQALVNELGTTGEPAEAVKRRLGLATGSVAAEDKRAVEIIYKTASEQLMSLRNTINYFVNTRPTEAVHSIVLSGGGAQLHGLPEDLADMTRLRVEVGDPFSTVALAKGINAEELRSNASTFTVALGLALGRAA
ncbi:MULTISPECIES: type IV pilus assembly protein PilM [Cryobacterium]|uniref:Type IV pilus assembly protein PilM n=1 Tax=Cryobacterium breve TaxID=1259258 RepID=A0ABY2J2U2_9MICO|nr:MULTISPECIES: type IV pilus assembly protein PilM [Cryobacterium]TFC91822.1 type IV pilus assembly protein PilM [Cryobacterium sp. TmT3-12]TFC98373.1 type IV pilus assembly protein PilM [Cryobacterium breve]